MLYQSLIAHLLHRFSSSLCSLHIGNPDYSTCLDKSTLPPTFPALYDLSFYTTLFTLSELRVECARRLFPALKHIRFKTGARLAVGKRRLLVFHVLLATLPTVTHLHFYASTLR